MAAMAPGTTTMTDRRAAIPIPAIGAALFCVVLILLALQVRAGGDPALGAAKPAAQPARPVVVRRVVVTRRVVDSARPGGARSARSTSGGSAPATSHAAAAPPAPAAAAAPASAAAPAPAQAATPAPARAATPAPAAPPPAAPVVSRGS